MIVDCHTHVHEYPGHLSDEFVREAQARSRSTPVDVSVTADRHWKAMGGVDKVIVLGMRAFHSGIMVPNEYVAEYANRHPEKVIGFAGVDPARDHVPAPCAFEIFSSYPSGRCRAPVPKPPYGDRSSGSSVG